MRSKITDVQIKHWLKSGKNVAKAQGEVPGLTLTVSAAGTATWILRYRIDGKQREVTIGRYPEYSIVDAKNKAIDARRKIMDGIDVAREKQQGKTTRAANKTFEALALDYEAKILPGMAASTIKARQYHIHSWLIPKLGNIAAKDVVAADIVELIEAAGERSYTATNLIFGTLSAIFDHGMGKKILATNPCQGIKLESVLGVKPATRKRVKLTDEELRLILPALPNDRNGIVIRLLLITGVRVSELLQAEWRHIDFDRAKWTVPEEHIKTRRRKEKKKVPLPENFTIPLPHQAVDLFKQLQVLACGSPYVLPGLGRKTMDRNTVLAALGRLRKQIPEVRHFSPHDLRSTCRSHLSSLGISVVVAERCLNHSLGGMVEIYDQHDYLEERRRALSLWCDYLTAIEEGKPWLPEADNVGDTA